MQVTPIFYRVCAVRFDTLAVVTTEISAPLDVTMCSLAIFYQLLDKPIAAIFNLSSYLKMEAETSTEIFVARYRTTQYTEWRKCHLKVDVQHVASSVREFLHHPVFSNANLTNLLRVIRKTEFLSHLNKMGQSLAEHSQLWTASTLFSCVV